MNIIRNATESDFNILVDFQELMYSPISVSYFDFMKFWFSKNQDEINKSIILYDEDNQVIRGQLINSSMKYFYNNELKESVWPIRYMVQEEYRKFAWGLDILLECMEQYPTYFSTGAGPNSLPIEKKLGKTIVGEIRKYIGLLNPIYFFTSFKREVVPIQKFPNSVNATKTTFNKLSINDIPNQYRPYNNNLFEPSRDNDYLKWRFWGGLHDYAFYKANDSNDYFVLRTIVEKGITIMLLADYRCNTSSKEPFENILNAACKITRKLHLPVLFTGSTLSVVDSVLEQHHFKSMGRPRPVLSTIKFKDRNEDIKQRNFCFITLADSDGETNR